LLSIVFVIENNVWGMGTHYKRALAMDPIGPSLALTFGIESHLLDGMNVLDSYQLFKEVHERVRKNKRLDFPSARPRVKETQMLAGARVALAAHRTRRSLII
jgi:hypothetical protein